jgi:plastocyanin
MTKALIVGAIGIAIAGGGYYWFSAQEAPRVPGEVAVEISYTENGYDPAEVSIKKGQAVKWINNSSAEMWPASAVHPTHSIYPEKSDSDCLGSSFDACRRMSPGESYEFTFHEAGDWKFHDHVRPSKTGVVHVTE